MREIILELNINSHGLGIWIQVTSSDMSECGYSFMKFL